MSVRKLVATTSFGLLSVAALTMSTPVMANWWKCPDGQYQLEVNQSQHKARCVKPGQRVRRTPDAGCPVGTTHNVDHRRSTDYCLPVTGSVGGRPFLARCAPGQSVERRNGRDRCFVQQAAAYAPVRVLDR